MRPAKRLHSHSSPLSATGNISVVSPHISRHTDNTYDSAGRLIITDISENGKSASVKRFYGQNGLLSKEKFGNGVDRTYRYDVHGWPTSNTIGLAPLSIPATRAGTLSATYYNSLDGTLQGDRDPDDLVVRDRYTETLFYADGIYPRYSGCPSAKETSLGGRYDYRFDAHDRLTKADYTAPDSEDEDFSAEYTYDDLGNPLMLKRWGIIDYTSGGEATYGLLDDLTFSYPSGSSQLESVTSASEGTDFYGRVGFPLAGSQYTWNDAGLMASDSGFGITAITYNDFGLPVKFHTQNKKNYTAYSYSADGALLQKEVSTSTSSPFPFTSKSETTYSAGRIFYSGTRSNPLGTYVSYFPGGYFDSNGGVHYMHLDYQGSVVMETDSTGHIEKHRGYYPYGEPWAESTNKKTLAASVAQPQTYQSKERTAATGDYDFGPRRYISAAPFWRAPDPKAHDYPNISPYAFCAANPIRYADPTGMDLFYMNREGRLIYRVENDSFDRILIKKEDGEFSKSKFYTFGTISEVGKNGEKLSNENRDGYTRFHVSNSNIGNEIFKFLADNITYDTGVEVSILSGISPDINSEESFSIIGTSFMVGHDNSMIDIINTSKAETVYTEYFHSHPFSINMDGDINHFNSMINKLKSIDVTAPSTIGIYYTGYKENQETKNVKRKTYHTWKR